MARALDPAPTLRHDVRLTTAARAKAVGGIDEVTRAALEIAERVLDNVVSLASPCRSQLAAAPPGAAPVTFPADFATS